MFFEVTRKKILSIDYGRGINLQLFKGDFYQMRKKLFLNSFMSMVYQLFTIISGLLLPRLMLVYYGSAVNGLVQSITQMLSMISLLDLGVGAVVQAALYKPLSEKNNNRLSEIFYASQKYFRLVAMCLVAYILLLCFYYSHSKSSEFSWIYSVGLIFSISIGYFAQYFFGISNTLLLYSDQKVYVPVFINLLTLVISTVISILLIINGFSVQAVKLISAIVFLARPVYLYIYTKRHYSIVKIKNASMNSIPNKWSGMAQHIATVVTSSVDNVLLTFFSTFELVSVYNVYVMPLNAIRNLIESTSTGYKSFFGKLIADNKKEELLKEFNKYEILTHYLITTIFAIVLQVLAPFVLLYTQGVDDANYRDILFCITIIIAYIMYTLRLTYTNLIFAAGKFQETQSYSIIECLLNISISLILVRPLGLSGVAIGTAISSGYRMIMSAYYLQKDIIFKRFKYFIIHICVDFFCIFIVYLTTSFVTVRYNSIFHWTLDSILITIISIIECAAVFFLFYKKTAIGVAKNLLHKL